MPSPAKADYDLQNYEEYKVKTGDTLAALAESAGISWQELAEFNWGTSNPKEINRCLHEFVGCRHRTRDGKNFIFTSADDPGIVYLPLVTLPTYKVQTGREHVFKVQWPPRWSRIELESIDEFGYRVPNVDFVLKALAGYPDVDLSTNATGYGKVAKVRAGRYRVFLKSGAPAYFLRGGDRKNGQGDHPEHAKYAEAVIDTRYHVTAVTRVVVKRDSSDKDLQERQQRKELYGRADKTSETIHSRGTETSGVTRRSLLICADNLGVAAGWDKHGQVNIYALLNELLPDYLMDRLPTNLARDYYVLLVEPKPTASDGSPDSPRVTLIDKGASSGLVFGLRNFEFEGLMGAYTWLEDLEEKQFLDIASSTYGIVPAKPHSRAAEEGRQGTAVATEEGDSSVAPGTGLDDDDYNQLENHVVERDRYIKEINSRNSKVQVLFWLPSLDVFFQAALHGGTGRLEDYPEDQSDDALVSHIHTRNVRTAQNTALAHAVYAKSYEDKVDAIAEELRKESKASPRVPDEVEAEFENRLRKLGPPMAPYEMPIAANATSKQLSDILEAYGGQDELGPWRKIAELLDSFAQVKSQGFPFLRIKPKWNSEELGKHLGESQLKKLRPKVAWGLSAQPAGIEIESNLDIQLVDGEIRTLTQTEAKWVVSVRPGDIVDGPAKMTKWRTLRKIRVFFERTLPVAVEVKGKIEREEEPGHHLKLTIGEAEEATLKFADVFEVEANTSGNMKFTLRPFPDAPLEVESEGNPFEGEMMVGVKFSGKTLAKAMERWAKKFEHQLGDPKFLESNPAAKRFLTKNEGKITSSVERAAALLEQFELEIEVGYVGTSEESVLAVVSLAPGFFQRRSTQDLFEPKTLWNELTLDEQVSLGRLGWSSLSWDSKYVRGDLIPASVKKSPFDLSPEEKIGVVHLGFRKYADYAKAVRHARFEHGKAEEPEEPESHTGEPEGEAPGTTTGDED